MANRWNDQMYDHKLDPVAGPPPQHRLEYVARVAAGQSYNRGSVVSANSDGALVKGCAPGTVGNRPMPMFAIQGTDDLDTYTDQYNFGGAVVGSAFPATGGYEIATTEYVKIGVDNNAIAYAVNDLLTADADGNVVKASADAYGKTVPIIGIVSIATNSTAQDNAIGKRTFSNYGKPLLTFWTTFLPCAGTAN